MRLIDADAILANDYTHVLPDSVGKAAGRIIVFTDDIENAHTVDAVKVVRCKDCKHRPEVEGEYISGFNIEFPDYVCPCQRDDGFYNRMPKDDWFCANGERKEE